MRVSKWLPDTAYAVGDRRINAGNVYQCIVAGLSATTLGPSDEGADIEDGTVHWQFLSVVAVTIPLRSDLAFFDLTAVLDGGTYTLQFRWNVRLGAWFMQVRDEQDDTVLMGDVRLVADYPLASYFTGRSPQGLFMAADTSGQGIDPGLTDLGDRVQLQYVTAAALGL